jgi:uncharacterized protein (TIGR02646 family)
MRPVERGSAPRDYARYEDAKPDLVARLGLFCCYCERPIKTLLAVEHVIPKILHPELERDWTNFLLACVNCNSTKGDRPVDRHDLILPDQDNPLRAFDYFRSGAVKPSTILNRDVEAKAINILRMTGLDKFPDEFDGEEFVAALDRWQQRSATWTLASTQKREIADHDSEVLRRSTARMSLEAGFFSVWMTVFSDDIDMRRRFIEIFPGTSLLCFDPDTTELLSRSGGHC